MVEVVVALALTGLTVSGIVTGYIYCTNASMKDSIYMAANGRVMERIEEARSARWDMSSYPVVDQLVATNFPDKMVALQTTAKGLETISATIKTEISNISLTPPVRRIRVDCIWLFKGVEPVTNTIETCRAPDQ